MAGECWHINTVSIKRQDMKAWDMMNLGHNHKQWVPQHNTRIQQPIHIPPRGQYNNIYNGGYSPEGRGRKKLLGHSY
jgi:hypothetical protein